MYDVLDMHPRDYAGRDDPTGFDPDNLTDHGVDRHFAVLDRGGRIRARCSVWWRDTPIVNRRPVGAIGHYAADAGGPASALLEHACRELKARGSRLAVGPLDGSTWRRYRFITDRGSARPFFLEPDNPDDWPAHFLDKGFGCYARYVSALNTDIANRQPALGGLRQKFAALGVTVEPVDLEGPAEDLHGIYRVVCAAFADSVLFTPLDFDAFARQYAPLIARVDPALMLIARHAGRIVGFIFCPPDLLQAHDPTRIDTIVIKTVAVLPRPEYRGLGRLLVVEALANAVSLGYRQAISALMYAANRSLRISSDCARPMRSYQLFARELGR